MGTPQHSIPLDENRALPGLSIYMWFGCGIATAITGTRLITRIVLKKAAGWDDVFIAVSWLFSILLYTGTALLLEHGYGRHLYYIAPSDLITMLKLNTMVTIAGFASLAFARTSIGLFLLRLSGRVIALRWIVYVGLVLNTIQAVALIILTGVHCVPIEKMWDSTSPGFCIPVKKFTAADRCLGCLNVIVDLIFALYPLAILRQVHVERKVLLAVYLLLTCGLLTAVCSVGRVVASDLTTQDITWDLVPLTYWALSETSGVLILASLPAMRQLFKCKKALKVSAYFHNKMTRTTNLSKHHQKSEHSRDGGDIGKDLVSSQGRIRMQKDVYVELSDWEPVRSATIHYDRPGEILHQNSAQATAEIV